MRAVIQSIAFDIPKDSAVGRGLTKVQMRKIGETVILAGANGSGKTRLLSLVERYAEGTLGDSLPNAYHDQHATIVYNGIVGAGPKEIRVIHVPPGLPNMQTAELATTRDTINARSMLWKSALDFNNTLQHAVRMAQATASDFVDAGNARANLDQQERAVRDRRWRALKEAVHNTLNLEIEYDGDRRVLLDGEYIDSAYERFSGGQKRLFSFAVTLTGKDDFEKDQIVVFDEPETSLHPEAAIDMIKKIQAVLGNGQLWIATHSIPLISGLGIENVWYAENGRVNYGGRQSERVINSLIGGRDNLYALRNTIAEPDRLAVAKFTSECLDPPETIREAAKSDPQLLQFCAAIDRIRSNGISTLDWGAGRGRLKVWLAAHASQQNAIQYHGYEPDRRIAEECRKNIERVVGSTSTEIWSSVDQIKDHVQRNGGFQFVVMANVLHEIDSKDWQATFGEIADLLTEDGALLVLEDSELPVGEMPNLTGFLLVDALSCGKLFDGQVGEILEIPCADKGKTNRLKCFLIPRTAVARVSHSTIKSCISSLRETSFEKISELRAVEFEGAHEKSDYFRGHLHALSLVQFANANLALKALDA